VPLTAEMAEAISEFRHQQRIASENEAIRQLIEAGLGKAKPAAVSSGSSGGARKPRSTGKGAAPRKPRNEKPHHRASWIRSGRCASKARINPAFRRKWDQRSTVGRPPTET
jgi:hypothetical protein